jgi:hypothetical protein
MCMYLCMCMYMLCVFCSCVCLCVWVHLCVCMYACVCVCVCVCVCACVCGMYAPATVYMYKSEDNLQKSVLFSYLVGPGYWTQMPCSESSAFIH